MTFSSELMKHAGGLVQQTTGNDGLSIQAWKRRLAESWGICLAGARWSRTVRSMVITHEMGHVLGIGTVWSNKRLLKGEGGRNPTFTGAAAMREYQTLRGGGTLKGVPVEATGGAGTRDIGAKPFSRMN